MYTGLWYTNHKRNIANTKPFSNLESCTVWLANLIVCVWPDCYITWRAVALPRQCWPWVWFFIFFIDVQCIPHNLLTILSKNNIKVKYMYCLLFEWGLELIAVLFSELVTSTYTTLHLICSVYVSTHKPFIFLKYSARQSKFATTITVFLNHFTLNRTYFVSNKVQWKVTLIIQAFSIQLINFEDLSVASQTCDLKTIHSPHGQLAFYWSGLNAHFTENVIISFR